MAGPRSWLAGPFFRPPPNIKRENSLSALQEQRLEKLKDRIQVPFDETRPDHQEALKSLWDASFPDIELKSLISEQWKDMGWQGSNPSTDFRGCGFVSLENLLFFARTYPASFRRLLYKQEGERATWEYPFAVAGINVSFMLIQMLGLYSDSQTVNSASATKPKSLSGLNFLRILAEDEEAFDVLYCIAFQMMDAQWLAMRASYMQFNEVLQATRIQLERELALEDLSFESKTRKRNHFLQTLIYFVGVIVYMVGIESVLGRASEIVGSGFQPTSAAPLTISHQMQNAPHPPIPFHCPPCAVYLSSQNNLAMHRPVPVVGALKMMAARVVMCHLVSVFLFSSLGPLVPVVAARKLLPAFPFVNLPPMCGEECRAHEGTVLVPGLGRLTSGRMPEVPDFRRTYLGDSIAAAARPRFLPGADDTAVPNPGYEIPNPGASFGSFVP